MKVIHVIKYIVYICSEYILIKNIFKYVAKYVVNICS